MTAPGPQPRDDEIFLDHVAHWIPDADAAASALAALGFVVTPFSEQMQRDGDGAARPAGAGNYCVMLERGYLEFLVPLGDTPIGQELRAGIRRYVGLHITAFACADAERAHARVHAAGFPQRPLARLNREVEAADGAQATARFTVARPQPGIIAEGRVQYLTHHTPELLWQQRYVRHPNGASALAGVVLLATDPHEAARRYETILGLRARWTDGIAVFSLAQGSVAVLGAPQADARFADVPMPAPPAMLNCLLTCRSLDRFTSHCEAAGVPARPWSSGTALVTLPGALGASMLVTERDVGLETLLAG